MVVHTFTDNKGIYRGQVIRLGPRRGMLQLIRLSNESVVKSQEVTLSFGAVFGPDIADVREWDRLACDWAREDEEGVQ